MRTVARVKRAPMRIPHLTALLIAILVGCDRGRDKVEVRIEGIGSLKNPVIRF